MKNNTRNHGNKKIIKGIFLSLIVFSLLISGNVPSFAQSGNGTAALTFEELGFPTFQLSSKLQTSSQRLLGDGIVNFSLPYRWVLADNGTNQLNLHYSVSAVRDDLAVNGLSTQLPNLEIYVDGVLVSSLIPSVGLDQVINIALPANVINQKADNRHKVSFLYLNVRDCVQDVEYILNIYADTTLAFSYNEAEPVLSLIDFPRPLVQGGFLPEDVSFILPNDYGNAELSVVATISEAMGARGGGEVLVHLLSAADVSLDALPAGNLVLVGQPVDNPLLANFYQQNIFPTTIAADGTILDAAGLSISPEAGVLQLANHNNKFLLAVTGNSDVAITKAAVALASANPLYGLAGNLSVISDVIMEPVTPSQDVDQSSISFGELGISDTQLLGVGTQSVTATFYLPYNWNILDAPSLTLSFANSAILNGDSSLINVELNNNLVGSVPLTSTNLGNKRTSIELTPEQFLPGEKNRLKLTVIMDNNLDCAQSNDLLAWVQIFADSKIDIPHEVITSTSGNVPSFSNPFFYLLSPSQSSKILFVTPTQSTLNEMEGVARMSYLLGSERSDTHLNLQVVSDTEYLPENYMDFQTVLIGRPTNNTAIANINDQLVQPFVAGEDALLQDVGNIKYVLPPTYSVGVVQAIAAPWNTEKGVTVISGTTDEALGWALNTMTVSELARQLKGDLVFVYQDNIEAIVSDTATHKTIQNMIETVTAQNVDTAGTGAPVAGEDVQSLPVTQRNNWHAFLNIVLAILVISGVAAIVFSFVSRLRKAKK